MQRKEEKKRKKYFQRQQITVILTDKMTYLEAICNLIESALLSAGQVVGNSCDA